MDAAERRAGLERMRRYVAEVQPIMRLGQWEIIVEDERPASEDYLACVNRDASSWRAHIFFGDAHFGYSPDDQRLTVAHEMIHLHLMNLDAAFNDATEFLDPTSQRWASERRRHELEMATDALSRVIAPLLPTLPSETKEGTGESA